MTKARIVAQIYNRLGFTKDECVDIVDRFFETIKTTLANNEDVKISGFGNFMIKRKRARKGRNPQTGKGIVITER